MTIKKGDRVEHINSVGRVRGRVVRITAEVEVEGLRAHAQHTYDVDNLRRIPPAPPPGTEPKPCPVCGEPAFYILDNQRGCEHCTEDATLEEVTAMLAKANAALKKISAIRDSIVGRQAFHWSDHAYPLVAALDEAGFPGEGYAIMAPREKALIDELADAKAEIAEMRRKLTEAFDDAVISGHDDLRETSASPKEPR